MEPDDMSAIMLALMRIEGKVNSIIRLLEGDGQDED
jgi:DNA-binding FrmR family transcriptional regulator